MKTFNSLIYLFLFLLTISTYSQSSKKDIKINVYYFHFTARCITCKTVEAEAKKSIESLYPELLKKGKINFQSINLDDPGSQNLAKRYNVGGQTLLITTDDKKIDITREGFMYARNNPEKFKTIIKEKIDELLALK